MMKNCLQSTRVPSAIPAKHSRYPSQAQLLSQAGHTAQHNRWMTGTQFGRPPNMELAHLVVIFILFFLLPKQVTKSGFLKWTCMFKKSLIRWKVCLRRYKLALLFHSRVWCRVVVLWKSTLILFRGVIQICSPKELNRPQSIDVICMPATTKWVIYPYLAKHTSQINHQFIPLV